MGLSSVIRQKLRCHYLSMRGDIHVCVRYGERRAGGEHRRVLSSLVRLQETRAGKSRSQFLTPHPLESNRLQKKWAGFGDPSKVVALKGSLDNRQVGTVAFAI